MRSLSTFLFGALLGSIVSKGCIWMKHGGFSYASLGGITLSAVVIAMITYIIEDKEKETNHVRQFTVAFAIASLEIVAHKAFEL